MTCKVWLFALGPKPARPWSDTGPTRRWRCSAPAQPLSMSWPSWWTPIGRSRRRPASTEATSRGVARMFGTN